MLSDQYKYIVMMLDAVQGYPVKREVEDLVLIKLKLEELYASRDKVSEESTMTPQERWNRDVEEIKSHLFEDGSMYCHNASNERVLSKKNGEIANELIEMGLSWASPNHVEEAKKRLFAHRINTK